MTDATRWMEEDQDVLLRLEHVAAPVVAVLNKIDKVEPKEALLQALAAMSERREFEEVIPISAQKKDNLDRLLGLVPRFLPESEPLFPDDMFTDRSENFQVAEIVREKLTLALRQEIPYGLTVQIEQFEREAQGITVHAVIWVERDSQKGIVVGKGGSLLKKVGRSARLELKQKFGVAVHLELWVKVRENWADSEADLTRFGYESP